MTKLFVTGGAGYIGSHFIKEISKYKNIEILAYDNLSTGIKDNILFGDLVIGDLADYSLLYNTLKNFNPDVVVHFAASIKVGESVNDPIKYYDNNLVNSVNLLRAMDVIGIDKIVFSSTAAVYGNVDKTIVSEADNTQPINPYGKSKLMVEQILKDIGSIRSVCLRYFNVAGLDPTGVLKYNNERSDSLINNLVKVISNKKISIKVFGTDYNTFDGTCIRDYIHVLDIAKAHVSSIEYLLGGGKTDIFNVGYGNGYSVREIINSMKKIREIDFFAEECKRRAGDPACVVANNNKIKSILGWKPVYNDIDFILRTALL